ncbi:MarR family winged helix-turn-helix transcriptional regulator [Enemella sp. A6]|uniref:MarR family winged helix-turn-helix transcriptional regulator n=1 Tax=Enemella sp. A6 TaxID=3440152 RepID=UPI003EB84B33
MSTKPLPFDPIDRAAQTWAQRYPEAERMRAVTSLMRVHQLVITQLDELLRPLRLTFARYEVLVLLQFSKRGSLPLSIVGERLQVHATSVSSLVQRLVAAGLITREPHPADGRAAIAVITEQGREIAEQATQLICEAKFFLDALSPEQADQLSTLLIAPRQAAGDF